ncbi:MAG: hypothetical protein FWG81_05060 [Betaproteobacteria bacterium]|nr:hypothetical protein [Betaproteobacteria bacterium]
MSPGSRDRSHSSDSFRDRVVDLGNAAEGTVGDVGRALCTVPTVLADRLG